MAFDDADGYAQAPRTQTLLSQIVASLTDGIAVHDGPHLVEANTPLAKLLGFADADALLSADPNELCANVALFDENGEPISARELWHARVRRAGERTIRLQGPDGKTHWLGVRQRKMEAVEHEWVVTTFRDLTDTREASQLLDILESITDPFMVFDDELCVVSCNQSAARLVGADASSLIGKRLWDVVPNIRDSQFVKGYETARVKRRSVVVEDYVAAWQRWYEVNIYPLQIGIASQWKDVTVRKQALELSARLGRHAALRAEISVIMAEEREQARMLQRACEALVDELDAAFARVWLLDEPTQMLQLQASAGMYTHLDGAHRAVPVGKFKIGRIAANHKPHLTNDVEHDAEIGDPAWAKREGMVAFAGYPLLVDNRVIGVIAMFSRQPLAGDTMTTVGTIADLVAQGIQRRRAEIELEQRVADLARSNAELEQFAYVASHDLQEPLRMIASYNQLLARRYKGKLDSDADEFIAFTVEGVTRMQRLINDLLAYSRVGTRGAEKAPVELEAVLAATLSNLERAIVESEAQVSHDPLPVVLGNEGQLVQLLQNLVGNAIKFHGDARPEIHISAKDSEREVTIAVRDNGIGIEPQYFERVFVIFQRLNPREKYPGTGIGLAICKKIVERHGGRIWVESTPGSGSTVLFTLPKAPRSS